MKKTELRKADRTVGVNCNIYYVRNVKKMGGHRLRLGENKP